MNPAHLPPVAVKPLRDIRLLRLGRSNWFSPDRTLSCPEKLALELEYWQRNELHMREAERIQRELDSIPPCFAEDGIVRTVLRQRVAQERAWATAGDWPSTIPIRNVRGETP